MVPTITQLKAISKDKFTKADEKNAQSVLVALAQFGVKPAIGLDFPHRLCHFLAQLFHESGAFTYDQEIWGPTAAQKRYEGRRDLGNTQPGDGERFKGRTAMQLTGRANYAKFTAWVRKHINKNCPDFEAEPERVLEDPYEGLVPIWFWSVGNQTGKSLNAYADNNDIEMITRKINGGVNGLQDRIEYYTRVGLVLLGHSPTAVTSFQERARKDGWYTTTIDGDPGPQTRAAIHKALANLSAGKIVASPNMEVQSSPVVQTKEVAVAPKGVDNAAPDIGKVGGALVAAGGVQAVEPVLGAFNAAVPWIQALLIVVAIGFAIWFFYGRQLLAMRAARIKQDVKETRDAGLPT